MSTEETAAKVGAGTATSAAAGIGVAASRMSAAAIAETLKTLGSVVGGGMGAGVGIVCAIPLVLGGIGYGLYKKVRK